MSSEVDKICRMLESDAAELQCAAAMVLGELKLNEPVVKKALVSALKASNESVALYALDALAKLREADSYVHIIPLLDAGEALRAKAREVLVDAGQDAIPILKEKLDKADPGVRKGILEILGQSKGVDTTETLFDSFLDADLEVVKQATAAFRARIDSQSEEERKKTLKDVLEFLAQSKVKKHRSATIAGLKLLATLKDPATAKTVVQYLDKKLEVPLRSNALFTLNALPADKLDAKFVLSKLLPLLDEEDFGNILKPALDVLAKIQVPKDFTDRLLKLLKSIQPSVRTWALRALGTVGTAKAASALIDALTSDDPRLSETATLTLRGNPAFAAGILRQLLAEKDVNKQWKYANILKGYKEGLDQRSLKTLLNRLTDLLDKKEIGHQVYYEVLRAVAPPMLRDALHKRGRGLLQRGKLDEAERVMRLLERDDLATPETDYTLGLVMLRTLRNKDIAFASRDHSHASGLFAKILRNAADFPLLKQIEREAKLFTAPDLLYIAFVFSERQGPERDFGIALLKTLIKKFPSSEEAKTAKTKLKTQGG
jgi:HEAT repeat protein